MLRKEHLLKHEMLAIIIKRQGEVINRTIKSGTVEKHSSILRELRGTVRQEFNNVKYLKYVKYLNVTENEYCRYEAVNFFIKLSVRSVALSRRS